jgi:hypothetical protein
MEHFPSNYREKEVGGGNFINGQREKNKAGKIDRMSLIYFFDHLKKTYSIIIEVDLHPPLLEG